MGIKAARRAPRSKGGSVSRRGGGNAPGRDDSDAHLERIRRMMVRGNGAGALQFLDRLIRDSPDSPRLRAYKADVLTEMGSIWEAEECCREALRLDGNSAHACAAMGLILRRTMRYREAIPYYDKAIKFYERSGDNITLARIYSNKGAALTGMDRLEEARICYEKSIKANPDYVVAHGNMGALLCRMDRIDDAMEYFTAAKMLDPNFTIHFAKTG